MSKNKMLEAKALIDRKDYDRARAILMTVSHPTAREWITKIDRIKVKQANEIYARPTSMTPIPPPLTKPKRVNTEPQVLYHAQPTMIRAYPIRFIVLLFLCLFLVGIPALITWWLYTLTTHLTVTTEYMVMKKGILSKHVNETRLSDVRNVKISQTLIQRITNTGMVEISTAAYDDDILMKGIVNPYKVKEIVKKYRENTDSHHMSRY